MWKEINGFENYKINEFGEIINNKGKKIKPQRRGDYLKVTLYKNGKQKQLSVHRLVAEAFIPNPCNFPIVNHKDENKHNNKASNLEWCSHSYNTKYNDAAYKAAKAKRRPVIGINATTGEMIWFESLAEAERKGIANHGHVISCIKGKERRKTAGGYIWKYA